MGGGGRRRSFGLALAVVEGGAKDGPVAAVEGSGARSLCALFSLVARFCAADIGGGGGPLAEDEVVLEFADVVRSLKFT